MSFTGRPSRPPLALVSSSQIFIASNDDLPLADSGPVSDMPKPILIGSLVWAWPATTNIAQAARATTAPAIQADVRNFKNCSMSFTPVGPRFFACSVMPVRRELIHRKDRSNKSGAEKTSAPQHYVG